MSPPSVAPVPGVDMTDDSPNASVCAYLRSEAAHREEAAQALPAGPADVLLTKAIILRSAALVLEGVVV